MKQYVVARFDAVGFVAAKCQDAYFKTREEAQQVADAYPGMAIVLEVNVEGGHAS